MRTFCPWGCAPGAGSPPPACRSPRDRSASRKTTLVVMCVQTQAVAAMRRAERVVDVEHLQLARLYRRAELIKQSRRQPPRRGLARRILQTRDGRLRRQRRPVCGQRPDRDFSKGSCRPPVEVDVRPHSRTQSPMLAPSPRRCVSREEATFPVVAHRSSELYPLFGRGDAHSVAARSTCASASGVSFEMVFAFLALKECARLAFLLVAGAHRGRHRSHR